MKMVMAVVPRGEAEKVLRALIDADHTATFLETRGGMLRQAQMTLFIAVEEGKVEEVLDLIDQTCHSKAVVESKEGTGPLDWSSSGPRLGGAVVFVWDIERWEYY